MNTERILHIADLIEKLEPQQFDMSDYIYTAECGTVACIAGWTYLTYGGCGDPYSEARNLLGLDEDRADALFLPYGCDWEDITPAHAAQTLRKLAETGEVDWSHVS